MNTHPPRKPRTIKKTMRGSSARLEITKSQNERSKGKAGTSVVIHRTVGSRDADAQIGRALSGVSAREQGLPLLNLCATTTEKEL